MKKYVSKILLLISFIPFVICIFLAINCFLNGFGGYEAFGVTIPRVYNLEALKQYFFFMFSLQYFGYIYIPIYIICFSYQVFYLIKLKK